MRKWISPGRYVSGRELAEAGMAELVELGQIHLVSHNSGETESTSALTSNGNGAAPSPAASESARPPAPTRDNSLRESIISRR